ncbi:putative F-box domain-containing protein [Colletotrichum karsti]|uniref:F-box domain-containing protein n=1 Tax=Colletotrichum karsti TaxID=1095194 RepID=A0A9P6HSC4_9PEZI|nr:putative F-box domain-containing protein [Colletotrichum karsti]KAF9869832.1 putative F-box domain-containing protein [Colletotrichum karsti]
MQSHRCLLTTPRGTYLPDQTDTRKTPTIEREYLRRVTSASNRDSNVSNPEHSTPSTSTFPWAFSSQTPHAANLSQDPAVEFQSKPNRPRGVSLSAVAPSTTAPEAPSALASSPSSVVIRPEVVLVTAVAVAAVVAAVVASAGSWLPLILQRRIGEILPRCHRKPRITITTPAAAPTTNSRRSLRRPSLSSEAPFTASTPTLTFFVSSPSPPSPLSEPTVSLPDVDSNSSSTWRLVRHTTNTSLPCCPALPSPAQRCTARHEQKVLPTPVPLLLVIGHQYDHFKVPTQPNRASFFSQITPPVRDTSTTNTPPVIDAADRSSIDRGLDSPPSPKPENPATPSSTGRPILCSLDRTRRRLLSSPMMRPAAPSIEIMAGQSVTPDSRSSSSTNSPAPADNEESDFFIAGNDSQSSLGVPNIEDMQVNDDPCQPAVNRLPSEILISIFARLNGPSDLFNCMLTCKRWAKNSVDLLWHRPACVNWKNHSSICQTLQLENPFFAYRDFIKRLNLAANHLADKINDGSVIPLAVCTRVERLTLTNCKNITDQGLTALVEGSSSLLALDISGDENISDVSIRTIAQHCKRLQGLNISGCRMITNESMILLAENCKYIKRLKLNECSQLQDNAVMAFAQNCPNILEIDLHQCNQIGNDPITTLITKGSSLRELRLAGCELIDDNAFLSLPPNRTYDHLRILDLTSCARLTDQAVQKIIEVAPRLRNLVLAKCRNITDVAVNAISKLGKNLHYLHLGHCGHITDQAVKTLVAQCNRIRYIDLGCCTLLTDDSVMRLAQLPKLKRIGLVKCSSITDESVFALARANHRPRARRDANGNIDEYYASSLERSIIKLLNYCPRLTHLSLTGVTAFLREEFSSFCRSPPPEFTEHQRGVFCVFSGNGVSKLRDYLNNSPEYEGLRDSPAPRFSGTGFVSRRNIGPHPPQAVNGGPANGDAEIDDGEVAEEDEFEGLDGSEMIVDGQPLLAQNLVNGDAQQNGIPPPPPPNHAPPTGTPDQPQLPSDSSLANDGRPGKSPTPSGSEPLLPHVPNSARRINCHRHLAARNELGLPRVHKQATRAVGCQHRVHGGLDVEPCTSW